MAFTIITLLLIAYLIFRVVKSINKIRDLRENGINVTNKNWYYKLLSSLFLKKLPS